MKSKIQNTGLCAAWYVMLSSTSKEQHPEADSVRFPGITSAHICGLKGVLREIILLDIIKDTLYFLCQSQGK